MAAPGRRPLAYIPVPLLLRPQLVADIHGVVVDHGDQDAQHEEGPLVDSDAVEPVP